jgi:syntaxin 5
MGDLFAQMANMVAEQGEVILRIEDDVEVGFANTIEGHDSIQKVYAITKGNRSMIIKIFLLLLFFIFLFLVWT